MENRLYFYLGRRDKKGLKILTILKGDQTPPTRIDDVKKLQLPFNVQAELENLIYQHRFEWEPWIESAPTYTALTDKLAKRGFINLPIHTLPLLKKTNIAQLIPADTRDFPQQVTMVQRIRPS